MNDLSQRRIREMPAHASHSKQSLRLWLRLLACTSAIEKNVRQRFKDDFETTLPRFDVLAILDWASDTLTMGELTERLMVSNGNTTGVVKRLEREGLVERFSSPDDRRTFYVRLTGKGKTSFAKMASAHESWIDDACNSLNADEIGIMLQQLAALKESIEVDQSRGGKR